MIELSPTGRWAGRVTSRPLPDSSDEVREIDPVVRESLADIWWAQSATELRVARSFEIVHESLASLDAASPLVALAERAVDDEHRHGALCLEMARRLSVEGRVGPAPTLPLQRPTHAEARSPRERATLYVIGQCALNETFANAYLTAAYREATSPLARAAINELLRDEIDHSRLGWAFLSTLPATEREWVSDWLVPVTITNLREWHRSATTHTVAFESHGVPRGDAVREALSEVVREVLLPGFAHVGLDVRHLERWARAGMPT